jgi:hypothetical protein
MIRANQKHAMFFHANLGELISMKYPLVMYDVLDKNGNRDSSLGYFILSTGGVYIGAAAGQLPR